MKKNVSKMLTVILISTFLILSLPLYSKAFSFSDLISAGNSFLAQGSAGNAGTPSTGELQPIVNSISNILLSIALGVTLISAVMMAINFTIQSVEDKAKIKESMVPWVIGIFVAFGAFGIWRITMGIFYELF